MKYKFTKEELENTIKESLSIADVCRKLNIKPVGGNYRTLNFKIKEFNIDTSHFTGKAWNQGSRFRKFKKDIKLEDILVKDSLFISINHLKKRLLREGLLEYKCKCCGICEWNDSVIVLELDHINGISNDHTFTNLQLLCPNCHSQTRNFRGRNKKYK